MKSNQGQIRFSASDLSNHLACRHITSLDFAILAGLRSAPTWHSPDAWVLQQRGLEHENAYIESVTRPGISVADLRPVGDEKAAHAQTIEAMRAGVNVIVQAVLTEGNWFGKADLLRKVTKP